MRKAKRTHLVRDEAIGTGRQRARRRFALGAVLIAAALLAAPAAAQTINTITANPALPQVFGTPITWTVNATGGVAPLQYQFFRYDAGVWNLVKPYSTSNTYSWTPQFADVGQHDVAVWVKSNGSPNAYDATK